MKRILYTLIITASLYGCNSTVEQDVSDTNESVIRIKESSSEAIVLNNGKKWVVDKNMMVHIREMENDILVFKNSKSSDYKQLASKLEGRIELLTSNCTMEGQAHDELHKWLLPYIEKVKDFSVVANTNKAVEQLEYIENSFLTFNQYFE